MEARCRLFVLINSLPACLQYAAHFCIFNLLACTRVSHCGLNVDQLLPLNPLFMLLDTVCLLYSYHYSTKYLKVQKHNLQQCESRSGERERR